MYFALLIMIIGYSYPSLVILFGILKTLIPVEYTENVYNTLTYYDNESARFCATIFSAIGFIAMIMTATFINENKNIVSEIYAKYQTKTDEMTKEVQLKTETELNKIKFSNSWTTFYTNKERELLKDVTFIVNEE